VIATRYAYDAATARLTITLTNAGGGAARLARPAAVALFVDDAGDPLFRETLYYDRDAGDAVLAPGASHDVSTTVLYRGRGGSRAVTWARFEDDE
jgi:hypothetical protein